MRHTRLVAGLLLWQDRELSQYLVGPNRATVEVACSHTV